METTSAQPWIERALHLLGERLAFSNAPPTALLVVGGSALSISGLVVRTTKDIDVVALVTDASPGKGVLQKAKPLPDYLTAAAELVARDLELGLNWLNADPADLLDFGLPDGCLERSEPRDYGSHLRVYFIGRYDQIHLKLYAAVDQGGRHLVDLVTLDPAPDELREAAHWARTHDPSIGFRESLVSLLTQLGYAELADEL